MKTFLSQITTAAKKFEPDLLLSIKGEMIDGKSVEALSKEYGIKTALWFPDDPRFFNSLVRHTAPYYDYVFTKSHMMIPRYEKIGCERVSVIPLGCDPVIHKLKPELIRNLEVCFVGSYSYRRAAILKNLKNNDLHVYGPYWNIFHYTKNYHSAIWGEDFTNILNESMMSVNIHVLSDLGVAPNMRTFEIPACGALLLTDRPKEIEKYYDVGREILCYSNGMELKELVDFYKDMPEERYKISKKGYDRTIKDHTYKQRMNLMLSIIK